MPSRLPTGRRTVPSVLTGERHTPMETKQQSPSRPPEGHLHESVFTLRDAAKDVVVEAARWREQRSSAWIEGVLASAFDILDASVTVLGEVVQGEPADPVPNERARD